MHEKVGITPDRTGEMQVIRLRQTIMPERPRIIASAFKTFQKTYLQRLLFGLSADFSKQSLQFSAMRQIANFVAETERELTVLCELVRIGIFVNAIDCWNCALFQFPRHCFVCRQHEFFDQLMRFIVLDALKSYRFALCIDPDFYLSKIKIQRAVFESFSPQ